MFLSNPNSGQQTSFPELVGRSAQEAVSYISARGQSLGNDAIRVNIRSRSFHVRLDTGSCETQPADDDGL
jgi:hypothetical protein